MSLAERFAQLFAGRTDAYGLEQGGCERTSPPYQFHLDGHEPIGVYPMVPYERNLHVYREDTSTTWLCKWGCIDLDVRSGHHKTGYESAGLALTDARNLVAVLAHFDITGWIERTRGGGYHVWVFASEWVTCLIMRSALIAACQIAGVPPTEVNPKSVGFADPSTLGNYVRTPLPGALGAGADQPVPTTRTFLDARLPTSRRDANLAAFLTFAEQSLCTTDQLAQMGALYQPPAQERTLGLVGDAPPLDESLRGRLSGLTYTMFRDGTLEGQDRSSYLYKLALGCCADGLSPEEALTIVTHADAAHTQKYVGRNDGEERLRQTVTRAWR